MRGPRTRRRVEGWAGALVLCGIALQAADAQQMDPRSHSNVPIGVNFLALAIAHSEGDVLVDPSVPITDVQANVDVAAVAYVRAFALGDQSAPIGLVAPHGWLSANGLVEGQAASVSREGIGDPTLRLTVNLHGAPALPVARFATYQQDVIVGLALLVTAPLGQYRAEKLVNIGTNRWSVKPEIGESKALGRWTLEGAVGATLYSDNDDFLGKQTREQDPLYAMQAHAI